MASRTTILSWWRSVWEARLGRSLTPIETRRFLGSPQVGELARLPDAKVRTAIRQHRKLPDALHAARSTKVAWIDEPSKARENRGFARTVRRVAPSCPACGLVPDPLSGAGRC